MVGRRQILRSTQLLVGGALAGCTASPAAESESTTSTTPTEQISLEEPLSLTFDNRTDSEHTLELTITRAEAGEEILAETYELAADEYRRNVSEFAETGIYEVTMTVDSSVSNNDTFQVSERYGDPLISVYSNGGNLKVSLVQPHSDPTTEQ